MLYLLMAAVLLVCFNLFFFLLSIWFDIYALTLSNVALFFPKLYFIVIFSDPSVLAISLFICSVL